jgi:molybdopterin molybdotransferase
MDGWAVRGLPPWRLLSSPPGPLDQLPAWPASGWCAQVRTGSPVPAGTIAVLPVEQSRQLSVDGHVLVEPTGPAPAPGQHVRPAGEEARAGDVLLSAGTLVTPPVAGLAAAAGHDTLTVQPPAIVDVLILGDEIITHGLPSAGRTRDALGPQLPGWLAAYGAASHAEPRRVPDDLDRLVSAIEASPADVVVTTGGTSVGSTDHVRAAVARLGGRLLVDGVAVKPGHPMLLAAMPRDDRAGLEPDTQWLVGLPGNPLAACVAAVTLLEPLLDALHARQRPALSARLCAGAPARRGDEQRHRLVPVRLTILGELAQVSACGPAMLRGLTSASGLAVIGPAGARAGDAVPYLPLPWAKGPFPFMTFEAQTCSQEVW